MIILNHPHSLPPVLPVTGYKQTPRLPHSPSLSHPSFLALSLHLRRPLSLLLLRRPAPPARSASFPPKASPILLACSRLAASGFLGFLSRNRLCLEDGCGFSRCSLSNVGFGLCDYGLFLCSLFGFFLSCCLSLVENGARGIGNAVQEKRCSFHSKLVSCFGRCLLWFWVSMIS